MKRSSLPPSGSVRRFLRRLPAAVLPAGAVLGVLACAAPATAQTVVLDNGTLALGANATLALGDTLRIAPNGRLAEGSGRLAAPARATATLTAPASVDVGGLGFVVTSAQSPGTTTVVRTNDIQTGNDNPSIARAYRVSAQTNTGLNATLVFHYRDGELNGIAENTLSLFRSEDDGATWQEVGGTVDASANTITATGVNGFSLWTAGAAASLPVELAAFSARTEGPAVRLMWTTASETNNAGWQVEGAAPEGAWQALAFVAGAGTTAERHDYAHLADGLAPGRHRFRLVQTDLDGTTHLSPVVEATVGIDGPFVLTLGPNPAAAHARLSFAVAQPQHVRLTLFDALGREVRRLFDGAVEAGQAQRFVLDVSGLPAGAYLVRIDGEAFHDARPFVVAR